MAVAIPVTSNNDTLVLGYGGSVLLTTTDALGNPVASGNLLMTSSSFSKDVQNPFIDIMDAPANNNSRSKILLAEGTELATGSVGFDITQAGLDLIAALCKRRQQFNIAVFDGNKGVKTTGNYFSSLALNGSSGGLLSATLSFTSVGDWDRTYSVNADFIRDSANQEPYGYWYSGGADVKEWALNINQSVTPVYTNTTINFPTYLRVGLWDMSLQITTYQDIQTLNEITIATKTFSINGITTSQGYNFGGVSDLGTYTHTFTSGVKAYDAASGFGASGSGAVIFSVV